MGSLFSSPKPPPLPPAPPVPTEDTEEVKAAEANRLKKEAARRSLSSTILVGLDEMNQQKTKFGE